MVDGGTLHGFIGEIWTHIQNSLEFNYTINIATQYGASADEHGNWVGMMGMAQRREIDIALADFLPTLSRKEVADFTHPFLKSR